MSKMTNKNYWKQDQGQLYWGWNGEGVLKASKMPGWNAKAWHCAFTTLRGIGSCLVGKTSSSSLSFTNVIKRKNKFEMSEIFWETEITKI